jgi:hypothetical protein
MNIGLQAHLQQIQEYGGDSDEEEVDLSFPSLDSLLCHETDARGFEEG